MRLVRYGAVGAEKPGILDARGHLRDLSAHVDDIAGVVLSPEGLTHLRSINPESLPVVTGNPRLGACVGRVGKFICIGLNYSDHAAETGAKVPPEPILFMKATSAICGPNDDVIIPRELAKDRLGGRTGRGHRQGRVLCGRGRCDGPCRRLLRDQRRLRARLPDRAVRAMDQGQVGRHLRPHRSLAGDGRRGGRSAEPVDVAGGGRPPLPERQRRKRWSTACAIWSATSASSCRCSPATSSRPAPRPASAWGSSLSRSS